MSSPIIHTHYVRSLGVAIMCACAVFLFTARDAHAGVIVKPLNNLGLVGYWDFNEGTGTIAEDKSGNKNDGMLMSGSARISTLDKVFSVAIMELLTSPVQSIPFGGVFYCRKS